MNFVFFSEFNIEPTFGLSKRSKRIFLLHNDFKYISKSSSNKETSEWQCIRHISHKCTAQAITKILKGTTMMKLTQPFHFHGRVSRDEGNLFIHKRTPMKWRDVSYCFTIYLEDFKFKISPSRSKSLNFATFNFRSLLVRQMRSNLFNMVSCIL